LWSRVFCFSQVLNPVWLLSASGNLPSIEAFQFPGKLSRQRSSEKRIQGSAGNGCEEEPRQSCRLTEERSK
jgi:hypothetical protein